MVTSRSTEISSWTLAAIVPGPPTRDPLGISWVCTVYRPIVLKVGQRLYLVQQSVVVRRIRRHSRPLLVHSMNSVVRSYIVVLKIVRLHVSVRIVTDYTGCGRSRAQRPTEASGGSRDQGPCWRLHHSVDYSGTGFPANKINKHTTNRQNIYSKGKRSLQSIEYLKLFRLINYLKGGRGAEHYLS